MATISLKIDDRTLKAGQAQLRIRIAHGKSQAYVGTHVYVEPQYFTGDMYCPIKSKAAQWKEKTEQVEKWVRKFEETIFDLSRSGVLDEMTATDIKEYVVGKKKTQKSAVSFTQYLTEFGESRVAVRTKQTYIYTLKVLDAFCKERGKKKQLLFTDIDYKFLREFEDWLTKSGRGINTRGIMLRNIRAAYNEAMKCGIVNFDTYPFRMFSIKNKGLCEITCLSREDMHALLLLQDLTPALERSRDIFLISFYLCGMNLSDIYTLPKPKGDEIVFVRSKIAHREPKPTHIHIEPELSALIEKHAGKQYLFNFAEKFVQFTTFQNNLRTRFRTLSDKIGGAHITLAIARHTWATLACKCGVEEYVISKSLGHTDSDVTTRHYIEYDWSRTAAANRKVIDYIKQ